MPHSRSGGNASSSQRLVHYLTVGQDRRFSSPETSRRQSKKMRLALVALSLIILIVGTWGVVSELTG